MGELAKMAVVYGASAFRKRHRSSAPPHQSRLHWNAAVWRIIRTPPVPVDSMKRVSRT